jgi:transcription antitermination factor NusG
MRINDIIIETQVDEIDRRGFLKGMGAAALAGAAGSAMGQTQGPGYWANYAAELANNSIPKITAGAVLGAVAGIRLNKSDFEKMKAQVFEKVHKMVEAYCRITNSYNAKEIINTANSQAVKSSQADDAFNRGKFSVKFLIVYKSVLEDGLEQWKIKGTQQPPVAPVAQQPQKAEPQEIQLNIKADKKVGDTVKMMSGPYEGKRVQITQIVGQRDKPTANGHTHKALGRVLESIQ